jgi:hypothetical protein
MTKPVLEIDGNAFEDMAGFCEEVSRRLFDSPWHGNLDAFNDRLRGGFGTPEGGFILRWLQSDRSRSVLGYPETLRYLEEKIRRCHPTAVPLVRSEIEAARRQQGQTLFDILVEIIRAHCPGGDEEEDGVELQLA